MINLTTPYRQHEILTPTIAPFNSAGGLLWPTIIGVFLRPIIETTNMVYWFCYHGADFQFAFAHENVEKIEGVIESQQRAFQTTTKVAPKDGLTIGTAFIGTRWLAEDKIGNAPLAAERSRLVLAFLHATSALYLDGLIRQGEHWSLERNIDKENPLGNNFESLLHLVSNISRAQFDLTLSARTEWMGDTSGVIRCNL